MATSEDYLQAYDAQLRTAAETPGAIAVTDLDQLHLATFAGGRGFITYPHLSIADAATTRALVGAALDHYRADPEITQVEWKSRAHDEIVGLHEALVDHVFTPDDPESIMIGEARALAVDVELPAGVELRQVSSEVDVRAMCEMSAAVFGDHDGSKVAEALLDRLARGDGMQLWVAEADGQMIGAGRLEPVADSNFAGFWGGAIVPLWRGRGIYRALTAARARSALILGRTLINSDSTELSRPILERAGLHKVSSTTPYNWRR